jgi:hypothetical protein
MLGKLVRALLAILLALTALHALVRIVRHFCKFPMLGGLFYYTLIFEKDL